MNLYNTIYQAINEGVIKSLHIDDENNPITYQHQQVKNKFDVKKIERDKKDRNKKLCDEFDDLYLHHSHTGAYHFIYDHYNPKNDQDNIEYVVDSKSKLQNILKVFSDINPECDLNWINVKKIKNMSNLLVFSKYVYENKFNCDITKWDVSRVTDMSGMFKYCKNFNQDISGWDVSNVINMKFMFNGCESFNQCLNWWDVSSVVNMEGMFSGCKVYNQPMNHWNTRMLCKAQEMFAGCYQFNQPLDKWDISMLEDTYCMFFECVNFCQDLSNWKISLARVSTIYKKYDIISKMFEGCKKMPAYFLPQVI